MSLDTVLNGFSIGNYTLTNGLLVAPMAGMTDRPTRNVLRQHGAGMALAEMLSSDMRLWHSRKSKHRLPHADDMAPVSVQIAGSEPKHMAQAAQANVALGAQIIDINMGCPAKKVCRKAAGSALLAHPNLVQDIITAVVQAVDVPVTLKMRTGTTPSTRNGVDIAQRAQDAGIQAISIHGRTRACAFKGEVEYDTIAAIKQAVDVPVIANGDIDSPAKALSVLKHTNADGLMIGRGIKGNMFIFQQIHHFLLTKRPLPPPESHTVWQLLHTHLQGIHALYGDLAGPRIARKHVLSYFKKSQFKQTDKQQKALIQTFNAITHPQAQLDFLAEYFTNTIAQSEANHHLSMPFLATYPTHSQMEACPA